MSHTRSKHLLISVFIAIGIFIPIGKMHSVTKLPLDPYWRYQGAVIARNIFEKNHIQLQLYSSEAPQLLSWVDSFATNFGSPLIVTIVSQITGISIIQSQSLPLYALSFTLLILSISYRVAPKYKVGILPSIALITISNQFIRLHSLSVAHRSSLGWTLFLLLLSLLLIYYNSRRKVVGLVIVVSFIPFAISFQTLAVSTLSIFCIFWFVSWVLLDRPIFPFTLLAPAVSVIVSYYLIVDDWIGTVILKFGIASRAFSLEKYDLSSLVQTVSLSSGVYNTPLSEFILDVNPSVVFEFNIWGARIIAVSIVLIAVAIRVYEVSRVRNFKIIDVLLIGVAIQGFMYLFILPYFAASGGINPRLLGLTMLPILAVVPLSRSIAFIKSRTSQETVVLLLVVILFVTPALTVSLLKPDNPINQAKKISEESLGQVSWINTYMTDQTLTGDFNIISTYYTLGGQGSSYLPPPGEPAFATNPAASRYIELYYEAPSRTHADIYIVTDNMVCCGMQHLGALVTRSNPELTNDLSRSNKWNKIYNAGKNSGSFSRVTNSRN